MAVEDSITKRCSKCGEHKPRDLFSKHAGRRDGLRHWCRACAKVAGAEYRGANRDKQKAYRAARYAANHENEKAYAAKYRASNSDKVKARHAAYRAASTDKRKAYSAAWAAANHEPRRINEHNRRARKRGNGGKLSKGLSDKLFKLQRGKCACCGVKLVVSHMDHVIPLALEGPNEDWNMQLLCPPCNQQKYDKHPIDFMQQRGFLL